MTFGAESLGVKPHALVNSFAVLQFDDSAGNGDQGLMTAEMASQKLSPGCEYG